MTIPDRLPIVARIALVLVVPVIFVAAALVGWVWRYTFDIDER